MYSDPFKAVTRKLSDNVLIASAPFSIFNRLRVGARMSLFHYDGKVVVYSAFPYGSEVVRALKELTGKDEFDVSHIIVPNKEHYKAVGGFKRAFPKAKVITSEKFQTDEFEVDYRIPFSEGNKVLDEKALKAIGIKEESFLKNFQLVFLSRHRLKELVLYDKNSKFVTSADFALSFSSGRDGVEQYAEETGWPKGSNPYSGWSYLLRWCYPGNKLWVNQVNKSNMTDTEEGRAGIKAIYSLDFTKLIPCHGNILDDGKQVLTSYFSFLDTK
ncbi:hypothetical protein PSN45_004115 [Yamadazyma tenuis]|uniref:Metallo-beta-lactamase domain-containing protein n=1 Tax=Candida tenuis (strain ATCC 10573 / BCRC 21748 / CBS 615 / JCM 9827 / NBRC 10315 / NRRL Y-1498 / VKM Y-70) TaxID=590646 RepID=G3B4F8_CANTC|nr:uncharacterized protein CANTEDRAFT_93324 [Yamadazyma tenuis ATCC 10573]EGV63816.1 hypothetical protein CANTEDRAFT_93324 [Yamadazyma tenuis ATCC 10573]WEJ96576.1 hypothetical protein PSN45_004115 [Yamadazyma tenuis]